MRHVESALIDDQVIDDKDIEIEGARRIAQSGHAGAPRALLDVLERFEQRVGGKQRIESDHGIEVIGLRLAGAHRRGDINR